MTSDSQLHTPTPWAYRMLENGTPIVETADGEQEIVRGGYEGPIAEGLPNAAFIVRAVNAHDALVAALERAVEDHYRIATTPDDYPYCFTCRRAGVTKTADPQHVVGCAALQARAALTAARGGEA